MDLEPRPVPGAAGTPLWKSPAAWISLGLVLYVLLIAIKVSPYVGGSDSSGYYNSARLLSEGKFGAELRIIPDLPPGSPGIIPWFYAPLGFRPLGENEMVPTYPVGLPLLMAATAHLVGWDYVPAWVAAWNMLLGVLLTYGLARECGLRPSWSVFAAAILALSPLFLFIGLQPLSDVAALTWCTGGVYFAFKARQNAAWGLLCGVSLAIAVLIRPTNILMFLPVLASLGLSPRHWAWVIGGGLPGAVFLGYYNHVAYGTIATTGYGDMSAAFNPKWIPPTLLHYAIWLPLLFTPLVPLALGLPRSGVDRRIKNVLGVWIVSFLIFYCFYMFTRETWWYLRFLLPAAPAMIVAAMLVVNRLADRFGLRLFETSAPRGHLAITALLLAITVVPNVVGIRQLRVLDGKDGDRTYWLVADWLNHNVPENSVIAAMQNSGSLIAYSPFTMIRWDNVNPDNYGAIRAQLRANGRSLYAAIFAEEEAEAFAHMPGDWKAIAKIGRATVWQYEPSPEERDPDDS